MKQLTNAQFLFKNKMPYATIPKEYLKDDRLSIKAKGLLTIIYALPDDWEYSVKGLAKIANLTEETTTRILKEIINADYIWRQKTRKRNGQFKYNYIIHYESIPMIY